MCLVDLLVVPHSKKVDHELIFILDFFKSKKLCSKK